MKILFVCTGNTCRSPMAEGIAKQLFPEDKIYSAGLMVNTTDSVSPNAVEAAKEYGADISEHIPKQLTIDIIDKFDYIVPMTQSHKKLLINAGIPENKIKMFKEQISDPYGGNLELYKATAKQLYDNIKNLLGD